MVPQEQQRRGSEELGMEEESQGLSFPGVRDLPLMVTHHELDLLKLMTFPQSGD